MVRNPFGWALWRSEPLCVSLQTVRLSYVAAVYFRGQWRKTSAVPPRCVKVCEVLGLSQPGRRPCRPVVVAVMVVVVMAVVVVAAAVVVVVVVVVVVGWC